MHRISEVFLKNNYQFLRIKNNNAIILKKQKYANKAKNYIKFFFRF